MPVGAFSVQAVVDVNLNRRSVHASLVSHTQLLEKAKGFKSARSCIILYKGYKARPKAHSAFGAPGTL